MLRIQRNIKADYKLGIAAAIQEETLTLSSLIQQSSNTILAQVAEEFYLKGETDALISSVSLEAEMNAKAAELRFSNIEKNMEDVAAGADAQFAAINKYIRFEDGNIILGEVGNELTLKIQHDRISFFQSGTEVAYFSNQKMYVNDTEVLKSLRVGPFEFTHRSNGHLTLR